MTAIRGTRRVLPALSNLRSALRRAHTWEVARRRTADELVRYSECDLAQLGVMSVDVPALARVHADGALGGRPATAWRFVARMLHAG